MTIFIEPLEGAADFEMKVKCSLIGKAEKTLHTVESEVLKIDDWKMREHWGAKEFLKHSILSENKKHFTDGKLHFKIEIYYIRPPKPESILHMVVSNFVDPDEFSDIFEMMIDNTENTMLLEVQDGDVKLRTNKSILLGRARGFKDSETTNVRDFSKKIIVEMLRYAHLKTVKNIEDIDLQLFEAALHYKVKYLPELCIKSIIDNMNDKNILQIIYLADFYKLQELFDFCCETLQM